MRWSSKAAFGLCLLIGAASAQTLGPPSGGGSGGAPTGAAGGSLGGTYPNPTVTTNANLTGPITSTGNATAIASQTGTGTKFVVDTSPTLVTPNIGSATGTRVSLGGSTAVAPLAVDQAGGDAFSYRFNSSQPRMTFGLGGSSATPFFGSNLVYSGTGNVWNFDLTGAAWWIGNIPGTAFAFTACATTGTAGASAGTGGVAGICPLVMTTTSTVSFSQGGTPTIASGACGTGTNGTIGAGSTDQSGFVTIGAVATTSCTVSFHTTLQVAPTTCVITPGNATAVGATVLAWVAAPSTASWVINGSVLANTVFRYICI